MDSIYLTGQIPYLLVPKTDNRADVVVNTVPGNDVITLKKKKKEPYVPCDICVRKDQAFPAAHGPKTQKKHI